MYEERKYRDWLNNDDLFSFQAMVKETDLLISAKRDLSIEAIDSITESRSQIENYVEKFPDFQTTLKPYTIKNEASSIVKEMSRASSLVGVGPFAAVAGAIAEEVGRHLLKHSQEVIIENGGDIFIKTLKDRIVAIYAGKSPLSGKIGLMIKAKDTPLGICTSSGTVGHSLSFGRADAAVAVSKSVALADTAATKIGNLVKEESDIQKAIDFAKTIRGILGVVIIKDDKIGLWGQVEVCRI